MTTVHAVVPDRVDDPARPSGGSRYDRRVCHELAAAGWDVREVVVPGGWPRPDPAALDGLARAVASVPDSGLVLIDGLIASVAGAVLVPQAARLRLVVLVHMPLGGTDVTEEAERAVLGHARAVVTTSAWTRDRLVDSHRLAPTRVHVARPGADLDEEVPGTPSGGRLLCVAAVAPHKGQDLLLDAVHGIDQPWSCSLVGPLDGDPAFVDGLRRQAAELGIRDRVRFTGPLVGDDLRREYQEADVMVLPTRIEAYGMVVTEALAVGLPVVASAVGGVPEALGSTAVGTPGLLVPADDAGRLREALAAWLRDEGLRAQLRRAARARRATLDGWDVTARHVAVALDEALTDVGAVAGQPGATSTVTATSRPARR